jgi:AcrR family transcriptional regulator
MCIETAPSIRANLYLGVIRLPKRHPPKRRLSAPARREVIERAATAVFAERGYHGASMDEIARRSEVSAPVIYDHFKSKKALYEHLIDRHYAELRKIWFGFAETGQPLGQWFVESVDAWFGYVGKHPFAGRLLFRDTTGDPAIAASHRRIQRRSRKLLLPLVAEVAPRHPDVSDAVATELVWESMRSVLQGLALWWYDHPSVPRQVIVSTAVRAIWLGFERSLVSAPDGRGSAH